MKSWKTHLESVDESYLEHLGQAMSFARTMLAGALACAVHGLLPGVLQNSGSDRIKALHERMVTGRKKRGRALPNDLDTPVRSQSNLAAGLDLENRA